MNARERFVAACLGQPVDRPPVWLMRQAGRYLPEYRAVRAQHGFWDMITTPELAVEVTLQPIRRFGMDAAILFSDILIVLEALGVGVDYAEGGPRIRPKIQTASDLKLLRDAVPAHHFDYVTETLRRLCLELHPNTAVIGFAGAPFTLAAYLVNDGPSHHIDELRAMAAQDPTLLHTILDRMADAVIALLTQQIQAGVDAVQVFDTWAGQLSAEEYASLALPYTRKVVQALRPLGVPIIHYLRGASRLLEAAASTGCSVLSIDTSIPMAEARQRLAPHIGLQGNLDPELLSASPEVIRSEVQALIAAGAGGGHIVNLGEGLRPTSSADGVAAMVQAVQEWSA